MDRVKSKHLLNAEENTERSGPRSVSPGNAVLVIAAIGCICLSIGHPSGASLVLTPQGGCWSLSTVPTSRPPGVGGGRRLAGAVPAGGTPAPGRGAHRFLPPPCAELGDSVAAAAGRLGAQASSQGAVRWHQGWLRGEREPRHWAAWPRAAASGTHGRSGGQRRRGEAGCHGPASPRPRARAPHLLRRPRRLGPKGPQGHRPHRSGPAGFPVTGLPCSVWTDPPTGSRHHFLDFGVPLAWT